MPAAVVVAERPDRRQRRTAGQPRVALEDARHRRAGEDVLGPLAAVEGDAVLVVAAELVLAAVAVVDERADGGAGRRVALVEERDRHVVGVELGARHVGARVVRVEPRPELGRRVLVEDVGVPHREVAAAPVVVAALLAEAVDRVVATDPAARRPRVVERRVGPVAALRVRRRLDDDRPVGAVHVDAERVEPERHDELVGDEPPRALPPAPRARHATSPARRGRPRSGRRTRHTSASRRTTPPRLSWSAHDVGAHRVDAQLLTVQPGEQPVRGSPRRSRRARIG